MEKENKPINDVMEHMYKIEGNVTPATTTDMKKLPRPVRYIGYFIIASMALSAFVLIILSLLK